VLQEVDAVTPIPVVASGGIADGRGLAAAFVLGASGVRLGTCFLATVEAPVAAAWKQRLVDSASDIAVKFDVLNDINPTPGLVGYGRSARALRTPFTDEWEGRAAEAREQAARLQSEPRVAGQAGCTHELLASDGRNTGLVHEVLSVKEMMQRLMVEAEEALNLRVG
jgi:enoyl-[acyl-carrier protein] reductase II